ncbi:hypothetical protein T4B_10288 [Trichinella pseudospiralis]|uniref:Uncharacterized protein n=1 Tax=Trichinella pseudospiralis TaxID=6337 RepID=A0A0V1DWR8_TRIPS|nr:hypothetical protein T4A_792 [Trichinella pseudospiralis]KRZ18221.1 hypothetical protein T4B_10288 [Trichinella pseudospiralis]KRZ35197.1 hypothetical protein T4C_10817 [Trichinella pseudospiralis]
MLCLERLLKFYSYPLHSMVFKEHRPILIVIIILLITIAKMSIYWLDAWNQNAQDVPSICLYQDVFSRCYYEWLLKINLAFSVSTFLPYSIIYVGLIFQKSSGGMDLSSIKFNRERSITKSIVAILSMTLICQIIPWAIRYSSLNGSNAGIWDSLFILQDLNWILLPIVYAGIHPQLKSEVPTLWLKFFKRSPTTSAPISNVYIG